MLLEEFLNRQEVFVVEQRFGLTDPLFRPQMRRRTLQEIADMRGKSPGNACVRWNKRRSPQCGRSYAAPLLSRRRFTGRIESKHKAAL